MQTFDYLREMGVTQYRRRELEVAGNPIVQSSVEMPVTEPKPVSVGLSKTFDQSDDERSQTNPVAISQNVIEDQHSFELLIWQGPGLLVLEFSQNEADQLSLKHKLANNILKATFSNGFKGAAVSQHLWPLPGISMEQSSANDWIGSLVSGHLQQNPGSLVWLMGAKGIELLFPHKDGELESLLGTKIKHPDLSSDFLITPSLSEMLGSTVAKVQAWQILSTLRVH